jgi:hypothetical protein
MGFRVICCKYLKAGVIPGFQMLRTWGCRRDQIMALGLSSESAETMD